MASKGLIAVEMCSGRIFEEFNRLLHTGTWQLTVNNNNFNLYSAFQETQGHFAVKN